MKLVGFEVNALHFFITHGASCWVFASIQSAGDLQAFCRGRRGDEIDDGFVVLQRFSAPV